MANSYPLRKEAMKKRRKELTKKEEERKEIPIKSRQTNCKIKRKEEKKEKKKHR